jgi:drug/metabolite transporter (DMT)-like permease
MQSLLSIGYIWRLACAVVILGIYALLWQQIIKRMPVSDAYMFKGMSLIFVMLLSHFIFGEIITLYNGIGAIVIIGGIALFAKS